MLSPKIIRLVQQEKNRDGGDKQIFSFKPNGSMRSPRSPPKQHILQTSRNIFSADKGPVSLNGLPKKKASAPEGSTAPYHGGRFQTLPMVANLESKLLEMDRLEKLERGL